MAALDSAAAGKEENETKQPQQKRTRARLSCNVCRVKRRKCNGVAPNPCNQCISAGAECSWAAERKRGPPSIRPLIRQKEKLEEHLQLLWHKLPELCILSEQIAAMQLDGPPNPSDISVPAALLAGSVSRNADAVNNHDEQRARHDAILSAIYGKDGNESGDQSSAQPRRFSSTSNAESGRNALARQDITAASQIPPGSGWPTTSQLSDLGFDPTRSSPIQKGSERQDSIIQYENGNLPEQEQNYDWTSNTNNPFENLDWGGVIPMHESSNPIHVGTTSNSESNVNYLQQAIPTTSASANQLGGLPLPYLQNEQLSTSATHPGRRDTFSVSNDRDTSRYKVWETSESTGRTGFFFGRTSGMYRHSARLAFEEKAPNKVQDIENMMASMDGNVRAEISDIYLTYIHTYAPILDKDQIMRWSAMAPSTSLHPALLCAIIVITNPYLQASNTCVGAEEMAVQALESASEVASLQYIQAYVLLAISAWNRGLVNKARRRVALAASAALDMGIHCLHTRMDLLPHPDQEAIFKTWHCLYNLDTLLAFHLGRPAILQGRFDVPEPSLDGTDEWEAWKPDASKHLLAEYGLKNSEHTASGRSRPAKTLSTFRLMISLCKYARLLTGALEAGEGHAIDAAELEKELDQAVGVKALRADTAVHSSTQHYLDVRCLQVYFSLVLKREGLLQVPPSDSNIATVQQLLRQRLHTYTFLRSPFLSMLLPLMLQSDDLQQGSSPMSVGVGSAVQEAIKQYCSVYADALKLSSSPPMHQKDSVSNNDAMSTLAIPHTTIPSKRAWDAVPDLHDVKSQISRMPPAPLSHGRDGNESTTFPPISAWSLAQTVPPSQEPLRPMDDSQAWTESNILASLGLLSPSGASLTLPDDASSMATMISAWNAGANYQFDIGS